MLTAEFIAQLSIALIVAEIMVIIALKLIQDILMRSYDVIVCDYKGNEIMIFRDIKTVEVKEDTVSFKDNEGKEHCYPSCLVKIIKY